MSELDDTGRKTFSAWGLLAVFVVLAAIGGIAFLVLGGGESATEQLDVPQTTTTTTTTPVETTAPVTVPGGAAAPEGVTEVVANGGVVSYAFSTPAELSQVPVRAVVPAATATPSADGTALTVVIQCSIGADEALAQLTVTTDPTTVTVLPVTIGRSDAAGCAPTDAPRSVVVPLSEPLGARAVVVVPAGTEVPTPAAR